MTIITDVAFLAAGLECCDLLLVVEANARVGSVWGFTCRKWAWRSLLAGYACNVVAGGLWLLGCPAWGQSGNWRAHCHTRLR